MSGSECQSLTAPARFGILLRKQLLREGGGYHDNTEAGGVKVHLRLSRLLEPAGGLGHRHLDYFRCWDDFSAVTVNNRKLMHSK